MSSEYLHLINDECQLMYAHFFQLHFSHRIIFKRTCNVTFTVQLIKQITFFSRPGLSNFIEKSGLRNSHADYNIVSIIGSQNSGKSTLLNRVFGTNFQMLQGSSKTQTTKGIWVSRDKEKEIIILDVEGSNSRQRGKAEKGSEVLKIIIIWI